MMGISRVAAVAASLAACGGGTPPAHDGNTTGSGGGIAAQYPGDVGIGGDPRVLFADDFESYATVDQLQGPWDAIYHLVDLTRTADDVYFGAQAVEMTAPQQSTELSNGIAKMLPATQDVVYLRYYSKFETTFDITGSSHNGGDISAGYYVDGNATPGIPADGTNKYLISYEDWRGEVSDASPGLQNVYIYHPEQRTNYGDHFFPNGDVMPNTSIPGNFGPEFVPRTNVTPELGRWYEYEVMLRANTPGIRDGRITCWMDGEVIADFTNLRLRDIATLKIDRIGLSLHFGDNSTGETRKWYDNVVVATEYIGPLVGR